jgi:hypothetical protein
MLICLIAPTAKQNMRQLCAQDALVVIRPLIWPEDVRSIWIISKTYQELMRLRYSKALVTGRALKRLCSIPGTRRHAAIAMRSIAGGPIRLWEQYVGEAGAGLG